MTKAAMLGDFVPSKLGMAEGERPVMVNIQNSYPEKDHLVMLFENGKGVRVSLSAYEMKGNRKKLTGAYSTASPIVGVFYEKANKPLELFLTNSDNRGILIKSSLIPEMSTRSASGVQIMQIKKGAKLARAEAISPEKSAQRLELAKGYRKLKVPATAAEITAKELLEEPPIA
jgi:DNA gyrase subunit A